ncbi:hypothetical protein MC7420_5924 [Coleofasciculus chthonoplastes PCC 7420]|uniref:Uncharacterized protein n=1 Tax=Coleofasciculus chthonoplastes PCC 7420 TaxID=118168 RepID=B4VVY6_9CYAN|nr:hypothetical protein MC7420_5924 [Coleofasciculus chthonoplastes PCC 7420]
MLTRLRIVKVLNSLFLFPVPRFLFPVPFSLSTKGNLALIKEKRAN